MLGWEGGKFVLLVWIRLFIFALSMTALHCTTEMYLHVVGLERFAGAN